MSCVWTVLILVDRLIVNIFYPSMSIPYCQWTSPPCQASREPGGDKIKRPRYPGGGQRGKPEVVFKI
jgi:hypothetical protein